MSDFNEKGKDGGQNGVPDNTSSGNPSDPWSINSILKNQDNDIFSSSEIDSGRSFNDTDEIYSGRPSGTDKKREDVPVGRAKSSKSRKKKKKKMGRIKRTFLSLFLICIITVCLVTGAFGIYVFAFIDGDIPYDLNNLELQYTSIVYAYDTDIEQYYEMASFHGTENRI